MKTATIEVPGVGSFVADEIGRLFATSEESAAAVSRYQKTSGDFSKATDLVAHFEKEASRLFREWRHQWKFYGADRAPLDVA